MSEKLVMVAHTADRSYVFAPVDAEGEWNLDWARAKIDNGSNPFKRRRGDALLLAHDMQNRLKTEHGVRELFLEDRPRRKRGKREEDKEGKADALDVSE